MPASNQPARSKLSLADRLAAARRGRFVGREAELELFRSALLAEESPFTVLYLYGPGGIGKTALLREYTRMAKEHGVPAILVDGRNVEPSPQEFLFALRQTLGLDEKESPIEFVGRSPRSVLLLDTYETLSPLDAWLRETFLPQLGGSSLVVIAGRTPPVLAWRSDLDWSLLTRIVSLRNLLPEESKTFLANRGIPEEQHSEMLAFTHGHPLALSLVADVRSQNDAQVAFEPEANPDIVQLLLERFIEQVPGPIHRQALEICAHVRITTEALLADILGAEKAAEVFSWMRRLSFIEQSPKGLFPHDLARDILDADLRWRNLQAYKAMHHQVQKFYGKVLKEAQGHARRETMTDITYLYRYNSITRSFFDWEDLGNAYAEPATTGDEPIILEMVRRHEGDASAEIAQYWFQHQPEAFSIFRKSENHVLGFIAMLKLSAITSADMAADPAMAAAKRFIERFGPLRTDEELDYIRFWMGSEKYQNAAMNNLVTMVAGAVFRKGDPKRVWSLAAIADADHWEPFFAYLNFAHTGEADFTVAGRRFGVFTHDWRIEPADVWSKRLGERQLVSDLQKTQETASSSHERFIVLSKPEFGKAVRQALRNYTRPAYLTTNPLLHSRLLSGKADLDPTSAALQALLLEAVNALNGNPKDKKLYRAIWRTYIEPAHTQEQAAERLNLPFSTYRYHLSNGIERIIEWMWQQELYSFES